MQTKSEMTAAASSSGIVGVEVIPKQPAAPIVPEIVSRGKAPSRAEFSIIAPVLFKIKLKQGEHLKKEISLENIGLGSQEVTISSNLKDIVSISDGEFVLSEGATKIITIDFLGTELGVYTGTLSIKAYKFQKNIPIVVEVESARPLYDITLYVPPEYKYVFPGDDILAQVTIFNIAGNSTKPATIYYRLQSFEGETFYYDQENITVTEQASFTKKITLPTNIADGDYVLSATIVQDDFVGTSSEIITIGEEVVTFGALKMNRLNITFSAIIILLLICTLIGLIYYQQKLLKKPEIQKPVKKLKNKKRKNKTT